jgi:hypothetical protein
MLPIYSTYYLNRLVTRLVPKTRFFRDTFFKSEVQSDKEEIYFDENTDQRIGAAPFVHPLLEAPMFRDQGYSTKSFKPAYIKEKTGITSEDGDDRLPGEDFGGVLTPMQRAELRLIQKTTRLYERLRVREELMALEVVKTGKLTIRGEGFDSTIDFKRDPALTQTLSGQSTWANPDFPLLNYLESFQGTMAEKNLDQRRPRLLIVGRKALECMRNNKEVKALFPDYMRLSGDLSLKVTPQDGSFENLVYRGYLGNMDIWLHEGKTDQRALDIAPNQALFVCNDIQGVRHYGAIRDLKAGLKPQRVFVKSWEEEDPSQRIVLLQCAPLFVTYDPNTAGLVDVCPP